MSIYQYEIQDKIFISYTFVIKNKVIQYANPFMVSLGLVLNLFCIVVFCQKSFKKSSIRYHGILMGIVNILLLAVAFYQYNSVLNQFRSDKKTDNSTIISNRTSSDLLCKLGDFLSGSLSPIPSWLNVLITFDRAVCVIYPTRFYFLRSKIFITIAVAVILTMSCGLSSLGFLSRNIQFKVNDSNKISFVVKCTSDQYIIIIRDTLWYSYQCIIPIIFIILMDIVLLKKLKISKSKLDKNNRRENQFASSVIILNTLFALSLAPLLIVRFLLNIYAYGEPRTQVSVQVQLLNLLNLFAYYIYAYNIVFSFFVYIKFNKLFRKEFFRILSRIYKRMEIRKRYVHNVITVETRDSSISKSTVKTLKNESIN